MPPPSNQRADIEPPEEVTTQAVTGFATGALRFGSLSIIAHMILSLPHPFKFAEPTPPPTPHSKGPQLGPRPTSPFSSSFLKSRLFYRPLEGFSEWLSPTSQVYRGLTPQFKVFLQIAVMTLGGCIWAEKRVSEYLEVMRKIKRAERTEAQRAQTGRG
ncbi:hypothetical protein DTO271G3_1497 [Paecilomyces variotii]|nr:hypothetical protein DTO271G3_1497 [Paecilomyces variotii]